MSDDAKVMAVAVIYIVLGSWKAIELWTQFVDWLFSRWSKRRPR